MSVTRKTRAWRTSPVAYRILVNDVEGSRVKSAIIDAHEEAKALVVSVFRPDSRTSGCGGRRLAV